MRLQLSSMETHQEIGFSPYNRKPKGSQDKVICLLENGWLKESPKRIKFYNSVKKGLDLMTIDHVMKRELKTAMRALLGDKPEPKKEQQEVKTTGQLFLESEGIV